MEGIDSNAINRDDSVRDTIVQYLTIGVISTVVRFRMD